MASTFDVNFLAALVCVQQSMPLLRKCASAHPHLGSRIIGLASVNGVHAEPGLAVCGAGKAALISLLQTVDIEESTKGVMATAISPGYVATDMSAWKSSELPQDQMITADDVATMAHMVLMLSRSSSVRFVVMTRSGSNGYRA